jgi:hypothetical protein
MPNINLQSPVHLLTHSCNSPRGFPEQRSVHHPLLQFSNPFCLSGQLVQFCQGQLVQFCQGQHGSKLVLDRLREGTESERNLVREECGLTREIMKGSDLVAYECQIRK